MNSYSIKEIVNWINFSTIDGSEVPSVKGVYVFKTEEQFCRLKGESNILYIGYTDNLQRRLIENYKKGKGGKTTQRIRSYINDTYSEIAKIGWIENAPKEKEVELLKWYEKDHHELPPWNRQG